MTIAQQRAAEFTSDAEGVSSLAVNEATSPAFGRSLLVRRQSSLLRVVGAVERLFTGEEIAEMLYHQWRERLLDDGERRVGRRWEPPPAVRGLDWSESVTCRRTDVAERLLQGGCSAPTQGRCP